MAGKEIYIKIRVDAKEGDKSVDELNNSLKVTLKTIEDLENAQQLLNEELKKAEIGSEVYKDLQQQLKVVNNELANIDLANEAMDSEKFASSVKGLAGGLTDVAGGLALIGVSGKSMEQIAQTFAQIEGLSKIVGGAFDIWNEGLKVTNTLIAKAVASHTAMAAATTAEGNAAIASSVKMRVLNAVMNANPVFLLITGIGLLIGAFALFSASSGKAAEAEKKRAEETKKATEEAKRAKKAADDQRSAIAKESSEFVGLIYQLKETNKNSKERADLIKDINAQYGTTLKNISDEVLFQNQLNQAVKEYIGFQTLKVRLQRADKFTTDLINKQLDAQQKQSKALAEIEKRYGFVKTAQNEYTSNFDGEKVNLAQLRDRYQELDEVLLGTEKTIRDSEDALEGLGLTQLKIKAEIKDITDNGKKYVEQTKDNTKKTDEFAEALSKLKDKVDDLQSTDVESRAKTEGEKLRISRAATEKELQILYDAAIKKAKTDDQKLKAEQKYQDGLRALNSKYNSDYQKYLDDQVKMYEDAAQEKLNAEAAANKEAFDKSKEEADKEFDYYIQNQLRKAGGNYEILVETLELEKEARLASVKEGSEEEAAIIAEYDKRERDLFYSLWQEKLQITQDGADAIGSIFQAAFAQDFDALADAFNNLQDLLLDPENGIIAKFKDGTLGAIEAISMGIQAITAAADEIMTARLEAEAEKRQETYNKEKENLDNSLANRLISENEYDAKVKLLNQKKEQEEMKAKRKAFAQAKSIALINAAMITAQAVISAFAGAANIPIAGVALAPIMAGVAGALGAAQIAIIASQRFKAARGGIVPGIGSGQFDSVEAVLAPGETVINSNSSRMFPSLLSEINRVGGGVELAPQGMSAMQASNNKDVYQANREANKEPIEAYVIEYKRKNVADRLDRIEKSSEYGRE